jgi:hypothetical protein
MEIIEEMEDLIDKGLKNQLDFYGVVKGSDIVTAEANWKKYMGDNGLQHVMANVRNKGHMVDLNITRALYLPNLKTGSVPFPEGSDLYSSVFPDLIPLGTENYAITASDFDVFPLPVTIFRRRALAEGHPNLTHTILHEEIEARNMIKGLDRSETYVESVVYRYWTMRFNKDPVLWGKVFWHDTASGHKYLIKP